MTLTRQLARALKRIKTLEAENAELRRQVAVSAFVPSYPIPNMTAAQPVTGIQFPALTINGMPTCPRCGQVYTTAPHYCMPNNAGNYQPLYTQWNPAANATATTANTFLFWPDGEPVR